MDDKEHPFAKITRTSDYADRMAALSDVRFEEGKVNYLLKAFKRRIVLYDLNEQEREALKAIADAENRTVSRWVADAVRERLRAKGVK